MGVDFCSAYIRVAKQLLDSAEIIAGLKQTGSKTMTKGMTTREFADTCRLNSPAKVLLNSSVEQVMPPASARARISRKLLRWEDVLSGGLLTGAWIFAVQAFRKINRAESLQEIRLMQIQRGIDLLL